MVRQESREDQAAKDQREDRNGNAGQSGEEPDEKYEKANADAKERGDVDLEEHVAFSAMQSLIGVWQAVCSRAVFVDLDERVDTLGYPNLIRCRSPYITTVAQKEHFHPPILCQHPSIIPYHRCFIISFCP